MGGKVTLVLVAGAVGAAAVDAGTEAALVSPDEQQAKFERTPERAKPGDAIEGQQEFSSLLLVSRKEGSRGHSKSIEAYLYAKI